MEAEGAQGCLRWMEKWELGGRTHLQRGLQSEVDNACFQVVPPALTAKSPSST